MFSLLLHEVIYIYILIYIIMLQCYQLDYVWNLVVCITIIGDTTPHPGNEQSQLKQGALKRSAEPHESRMRCFFCCCLFSTFFLIGWFDHWFLLLIILAICIIAVSITFIHCWIATRTAVFWWRCHQFIQAIIQPWQSLIPLCQFPLQLSFDIITIHSLTIEICITTVVIVCIIILRVMRCVRCGLSIIPVFVCWWVC